MACKHGKVKTTTSVDDAGDIERSTCEQCGFVLREEVLSSRPDGQVQRRVRAVPASSQPAEIQFPGEKGGGVLGVDNILSAEQMTELAVKARKNVINDYTQTLVKEMLAACVEDVLLGKHLHLILENSGVLGETITAAIKELKAHGYKVKRYPKPGEGVWVEIQWPTKLKTKPSK